MNHLLSTFNFRLATCASRGFTPTPILVLFRLLKILLRGLVAHVQELISTKNISKTKKQHQNWCRGFTLVEVLVSLGIFAVLTGVVLSNYRGYNTNALFANASEDIVLALRQAQVYGVGVKGVGSSFTTPYGVLFEEGTSSISIFADSNSDGIYKPSDDLVIETINWPSNIKIRKNPDEGLACDGGTTPNLWVTFRRPNPDAFIKRNAGPACALGGKITIFDSNTNKTASVVVTSAGQISLQ